MTKLDELVTQINREHVYIQTHNFPDPDAIASAFGLQELLKLRGIHATICYKGKIDQLREILDIRLVNIENIDSELTEDDEVILVDAQKGNSNIIDMTGDEIICIDHHPVYEKTEYRFTDIRPGVGACASIIAQYFFENEIPMDQRIATALTFGIRMDTQKLSRGVCKMDMEMIWRMFDLCDQDMIYLLENSTLYFEDLMAYSKAISSIEVFENISFADTGRDCPEALIASVSDFMLALVEVSFSVVYSRKKEGIKISVRSERPTLDAGKIISKALKGIGSGGGHATMAGGFVPFDGNDREEDLMIQGDPDKLARVFDNLLRNAAAYGRENTQILIQARGGRGRTTIVFTNEGEQIPQKKLETIFERFYRVDEARSSQTGGAGLGLAIAKQIVELHGGTITATSDIHNTRFIVTLPDAEEKKKTARRKKMAAYRK